MYLGFNLKRVTFVLTYSVYTQNEEKDSQI